MAKDKAIAKDWKGRKVFMAESGKIHKSATAVDRLLELIAPFMGWDDGGRHVFVSDMSTLGDFSLDAEEYKQLGKQVGFKVGPLDYIHKIATRMRARTE